MKRGKYRIYARIRISSHADHGTVFVLTSIFPGTSSPKSSLLCTKSPLHALAILKFVNSLPPLMKLIIRVRSVARDEMDIADAKLGPD